MPDSSCSSGRVILPVEGNRRSAARATRAHSTIERRFVLFLADLEGDRACLVVTGEVDCRLRERGCRGVRGAELDRRSAFLAAVLMRSSSWVSPGAGAGEGFAASPR